MRTRTLLVCLALESSVGAEEPAEPDVSTSTTIAGTTVSGIVDAYVSFNPARSAENEAVNELHAFDTQANELSFSYAEIALDRPAAPVGFRLDIGFGPTADIVNGADVPNVQQAYAVWQATPQLSVTFGKMVTHHGLEVIETKDNWNYSHSLLFTWAIPFTQTGLAIGYQPVEMVSLKLYVLNGLNNTFDENEFKTPGLQVLVKPTDRVSIAANYCAFNELPGEQGELLDFKDALHLVDVVGWVRPLDWLELGLNADLGYDTAIASERTHWGVAGYTRAHVGTKGSATLRGEYFDDGLSPTLGILADPDMAGEVMEVTGTFTYAPATGLLVRSDVRVDHALGDYEPFTDSAAMPAATQLTVTLGAVASF
jgi:hypothetical protein